MRAVQLIEITGPAGIRLVDVAEPAVGPSDVLIDVHVAGVIFPDLLLSRGAYQRTLPTPLVLGGELAGVVRNVPEGSRLRPGMPIAAIMPNFGAFAESAAVPQHLVFPLPDGVPLDVAAGVPVNYLTMHVAFRGRTTLLPGETVLVHGAAGGVGVAAIQLARAWGARVIAVASSPEKREIAQDAGAHHVVDVDGFGAAARAIAPDGVEIVVDPVGGDRLLESVGALADEGRLLVVGFAGGSIPTLKVNRLLLHNQSLIGVNLGISPDRVGVDLGTGLLDRWDELLPLLADGTIAPFVGGRLPLDRAAEALAALEGRTGRGKIVLQVR
jgi:NADPH2:quinone reductase